MTLTRVRPRGIILLFSFCSSSRKTLDRHDRPRRSWGDRGARRCGLAVFLESPEIAFTLVRALPDACSNGDSEPRLWWTGAGSSDRDCQPRFVIRRVSRPQNRLAGGHWLRRHCRERSWPDVQATPAADGSSHLPHSVPV